LVELPVNSHEDKPQNIDPTQFLELPARFAFLSQSEYDWIRYPRSGATKVAGACLGGALIPLISIAARYFAWLTNPIEKADFVVATWEWWTIGLATVAAMIFWGIGWRMSKRTREVFSRLEDVLYPKK
jgi:hypothetical protein